MICMGVVMHKENHQTYVTNKKILSNQKLMMKEMRKMNNGGSTPPHRAHEPATSSDNTIPLEKWNTNIFPWADYLDVTFMPSSSCNTRKAPMPT